MPLAALRLTWALTGPLFFALSAGSAHAQSVALTGILGSKALLVVNGGPPRAIAVQEQLNGVRVLQVHSDSAIVEVQGQQQTIYLGKSPVSIGQAAPIGGSRKVVLRPDSQGHFRGNGWINNKPMDYMVDTGASVVALSQQDAQRLGLNTEQGQRVMLSTANGNVQGWRVQLPSMRVGDIQLHGVDAVITPQDMPYVLLGNSFLSKLHLTRSGNQMVLEQR